MPRPIDPTVEAAIREALADPTASYADIAEKVGRHTSTIRYHAIRWGLERDTRATLTTEQRDKIRRMLRAGCWTYRQIAEGAKCSTGAVQDAAAELGLDREGRKPAQFQKRERTP